MPCGVFSPVTDWRTARHERRRDRGVRPALPAHARERRVQLREGGARLEGERRMRRL